MLALADQLIRSEREKSYYDAEIFIIKFLLY